MESASLTCGYVVQYRIVSLHVCLAVVAGCGARVGPRGRHLLGPFSERFVRLCVCRFGDLFLWRFGSSAVCGVLSLQNSIAILYIAVYNVYIGPMALVRCYFCVTISPLLCDWGLSGGGACRSP